MNPESRITIHMGINFIVSPTPTINKQSHLNFQQSLVTQGIDFARVEFKEVKERQIVVIRETPTRLEVKVAALAPSPVGQLLILAPHPERDLDLFIKEVEAIVRAFDSTWPEKSRQIISCDVALRDLFEASGEHAFQELWEKRLHQPPDSLAVLGRPVLGGGLRLVMPPQPDDSEPVQIEVKIESFLKDTKKIYVETQFKWPQPMLPGEPPGPSSRLEQVDKYIGDTLIAFIMGGSQ